MNRKFDLDDEEFQAEFLRSLDEIAKEAGAWRGHLPYDAVMGYRTDDAIRKRYRGHVEGCAYCQELISALVPP